MGMGLMLFSASLGSRLAWSQKVACDTLSLRRLVSREAIQVLALPMPISCPTTSHREESKATSFSVACLSKENSVLIALSNTGHLLCLLCTCAVQAVCLGAGSIFLLVEPSS